MSVNMSISHNTQENEQIILQELISEIKKNLQQDGLQHYASMTVQKIAKLKTYKEGFSLYKDLLSSTDDLSIYFDAYEFILQFRKFILGEEFGEINYTFVLKASERGKDGSIYVQTITLGSKDFLQLIKDDNGVIEKLKKDGDNIRISGLIPVLRQQIKAIQNGGMDIKISTDCSAFSLINEKLGIKQDFGDGKIFKAQIEALQRNKNAGTWYSFDYIINKDDSADGEAKVFSIEIINAHNSPESSSVFSALGKYFTDEMITKRTTAAEAGISIDPKYPNAGHLTELYILAKARLNQGHNRFPQRLPVKGQDIFSLYKQVKNSTPFYSGGDFLMNQIKSFLGSNPSLTSYKTIRNSINNFYKALNNTNIETVKQELSKLLLQNVSTSEKITKSQQQLSKNLALSFEQFFNDF